MKEYWGNIFQQLDDRLVEISEESYREGSLTLEKSCIKILGQVSLLVQPDVADKLIPFATNDFDALIESKNSICRTQLIEVLGERGLAYDDLSRDIWLPRSTTYTNIFDGQKLSVDVLDPISALVSKAVKAPDKNRLLIGRGIEVFGEPLIKELEFF